jgi:hypothetical protein
MSLSLEGLVTCCLSPFSLSALSLTLIDFCEKRELDSNLSGSEVYCKNSLILLVKRMLCNKLHGQKGFNSVLFSPKIGANRVARRAHSEASEASGIDPNKQVMGPPPSLQGYLAHKKTPTTL